MSIKTLITSALASAIVAGSMVPMASAANARDFDGKRGAYSKQLRHSDGYGHRGWRGHGGGKHYGYAAPRHHYGHYGRHRDRTGRNLAIGAFATILGIAIASEISRDRDYDYRY
jgi:hypothetical protein